MGVIWKVRSEKVPCASHEFARLSEVPVAHEVGIRMNEPFAALPFSVSSRRRI